MNLRIIISSKENNTMIRQRYEFWIKRFKFLSFQKASPKGLKKPKNRVETEKLRG